MRGTTNREAPTDYLPVLISTKRSTLLEIFEESLFLLSSFCFLFECKNWKRDYSLFVFFVGVIFLSLSARTTREWGRD